MKRFLFLCCLLISQVVNAQVESLDFPIYRGNYGERQLVLPVADSAKKVTATAYYSRGGNPLPGVSQPIVIRSASPGTQVIIRFERTDVLPDVGWVEVYVSGQVRASGRLIVGKNAQGNTGTPTVPSSTTVDLSDVYTQLDRRVEKIPGKGLSTLDFSPAYRNRLDSLAYYLSQKANVGGGGGSGTVVQPVFTVGTVTKLAAGSQPTFQITGGPVNYVINVGLPDGAPGQPGIQGLTGTNGTNGVDGVTPVFSFSVVPLPAGSTPTVTQGGTIQRPTLVIGIPKGDPGSAGTKGDTGAPGAAAVTPSFTFSAVTLPAGSTATVTQSGSSTAVAVVIGIPKGDKGDPGTGSSGGGGSGDMSKATYDADNNGKADDADRLGGQSASNYAGATAFSNHANNTNNPHAVTAAQVGAYTKGEVDSKLSSTTASQATTDQTQSTSINAAQTRADNAYTLAQGKASATHGHDAADITSGTLLPARLGSGSASSGKYLDGSGQWRDLNGAVSINQWFDNTLTGTPSDSVNGLGVDLTAELARIRATFVNNTTTTTPGTALDGRYGKTFNDSLIALRNRIDKLSAIAAPTFSSALVIVDFNSLGAGRGSSHEITSPDDYQAGPFPVTMMNSLTATFPSATFARKNFSVSGRQTPTMISQSGQVDAMYAPATYDRQVIVSGEVTNHIADGGATAQAAYASYVSYCKARRAKGFSVVSTTVLPRTTFFQSGISAATFATRRDSVNTLIRANFLQFSDVLADIATLSLTYPDGTHTNDAGYVVMGNYIAGKVAPLLRQGFNPQSIPFLVAGTTPVTTTPASATSTVLLLRGQGANNSTTITDDASPSHPMTANNTAKISTAQAKFGTSSIYLDGAANTHVSTPSSSDFDMGSGDFTMEAWVYKTSAGTGFPGLFARGDNTQNQWVLCWPNAGARLEFYVSSVNGSSSSYTAQGLNTTTDTPLNQWVHIALVRQSGATKLYQNGSLIGTATTNTPLENQPNGKPLRVGFLPAVGQAQDTGDRFVGYLHARITRGAALYTGAFTPPASF